MCQEYADNITPSQEMGPDLEDPYCLSPMRKLTRPEQQDPPTH